MPETQNNNPLGYQSEVLRLTVDKLDSQENQKHNDKGIDENIEANVKILKEYANASTEELVEGNSDTTKVAAFNKAVKEVAQQYADQGVTEEIIRDWVNQEDAPEDAKIAEKTSSPAENNAALQELDGMQNTELNKDLEQYRETGRKAMKVLKNETSDLLKNLPQLTSEEEQNVTKNNGKRGVARLQKKLGGIAVDGLYGEETHRAVMAARNKEKPNPSENSQNVAANSNPKPSGEQAAENSESKRIEEPTTQKDFEDLLKKDGYRLKEGVAVEIGENGKITLSEQNADAQEYTDYDSILSEEKNSAFIEKIPEAEKKAEEFTNNLVQKYLAAVQTGNIKIDTDAEEYIHRDSSDDDLEVEKNWALGDEKFISSSDLSVYSNSEMNTIIRNANERISKELASKAVYDAKEVAKNYPKTISDSDNPFNMGINTNLGENLEFDVEGDLDDNTILTASTSWGNLTSPDKEKVVKELNEWWKEKHKEE